jgi:hypothetical protein
MNSFAQIDNLTYTEQLYKSIKAEVEGKSKEYILGIDEEEYLKYLVQQYTLEPLTVDIDNVIINKPTTRKESFEDSFYGERYEQDVYYFTLDFPYLGSAALFQVQPPTRTLTSYEISVREHTKTVWLVVKVRKLDPQAFNIAKQDAIRRAFANVDNVNAFANAWNAQLLSHIKSLISTQRAKFLKENDFFAAINLKIDKGTESIFTAPVVKKINIPQPTVSKTQQFSSVPTLSTTIYDDILKVIYEAGRSMERKPSLYIGKDEEALRDLFLYNLETRYDSVTATGETFNSIGKTDIMLKYAVDGSNLFIAECKFWHGPQGFIDTINQLFDRYLTWRDTKVAIMMFVKNKDFTSVLKNIATEARLHPYFTKDNGRHGDTSFSFIYGLPNDHSQPIFLEIMAFHYDKV